MRDTQGFYVNLPGRTVGAFEAAGARFYNEAILVTAVGSLLIRTGRQFTAAPKLGRTHQSVLVFVKGDPRRATEPCGEDLAIKGAITEEDALQRLPAMRAERDSIARSWHDQTGRLPSSR